MKPIRTICAVLLPIVIFACAAPRTSVRTDDQSGTVLFKVNPGNATVVVDGKPVGKARQYDGTSSVLKLGPGIHVIRLESENHHPYETKVYLSDTREVIEVDLQEK